MMLGMLKTLSRKVAKEQTRNWHETVEDIKDLPMEVQNHLSLDRRCRRKSKPCERPAVRTALIV